jgi:hypothetical protein
MLLGSIFMSIIPKTIIYAIFLSAMVREIRLFFGEKIKFQGGGCPFLTKI